MERNRKIGSAKIRGERASSNEEKAFPCQFDLRAKYLGRGSRLGGLQNYCLVSFFMTVALLRMMQ